MPVPDHEELGGNLLAQHSGDSIASVPLKKGQFILSQPPSPTLTPFSLAEDCEKPWKKSYISEVEFSASDNGAQPALGTNFIASGSLDSNKDANMAHGHGNHMEPNLQELGLQIATAAIKGTSVVKDSNMDVKSASRSDMQSNQFLALKRPSELPVGEMSEEKFTSSDKSTFQRVESISEWHLACPRDGKHNGDSSMKEDADHSSCGVSLHKNCSHLNPKVDLVHHCVNRSNWDLNVPMDAWDASSSVSVLQDVHDNLNCGAILKQKFETFTVRAPCGESSSMLQKSNNLRLDNFSMGSDDCSEAEVGLDLQLRTPSRPKKHINCGAMAPPDLSLSSTGNIVDIPSGPVKPEPYEEERQNETGKIGVVTLKSVGFGHAKSEPCDGGSQGNYDKTSSGDHKLVCDRMVKSEPPQEPPQESLKRRAVPTDDELHDGLKMPASAKVSAGESSGDAAVDLISQSVISDCNKNHGSRELHSSTFLSQDTEGNDRKSLDWVAKSLKKCEVAGLASSSLIEPVVSDGEKIPVVSEGSAELDSLDDDNLASSKLVAMDEHLVDSLGNKKVGESAREKINLSADNGTKQNNNREHEPDNSHSANGAREKTLELGGGDDEYEDGEVRNSMSHSASVSLSIIGSKAVLGMESTDTIGPIDIRRVMPSNMDAKEEETDPNEMKTGHGTEKIVSVLCNNNDDINLTATKDLHESSVMEVPKTFSVKTKPAETFHKTTQDHHWKEEISEMKSKSTGTPSSGKVAKSSEGNNVARQESARGPASSSGHSISSKKYSALNVVAVKQVEGGDKNCQIEKSNSTPDRTPFRKAISTCARSVLSQTEGERSTDKRPMQDRPQSRWSRNDRCNDGPAKYESKRNQDRPVDKRESDFINKRKSDNWLGASYGNRNSGPLSVAERHNKKSFRFSRPYSRAEAAFAAVSDGPVGSSDRMGRRLSEDKPPCPSHLPHRWRSPGPRERPVTLDAHIAGCPARDVSASRYIGRDVPDPLLLTREDKIIGALQDDMMDPLPFPRPCLPYEQVGNDQVWRKRRNHSPIHRRVPGHLRRARSPQWSPSRRPSDVFDRHPELIRCRSPPVIRMDTLRSPHQHPCYPEDMMVRRHGSPFPRLLNDVRGIRPLEEHDLPRPGRVLQGHIRKFDLIGPHETLDEEHFRPFPINQVHELEGDDEFIVRKKFGKRHGFAYPSVQHPIVSNREGCLAHPVEDGPRPVGFRPDAEEMFPYRGNPQDFVGHVRNRREGIPNRLRGMAGQGEDYRVHHAAGRGDAAGFPDVRLKRRRL